jgi:serine/threonine-protein kinase
VDAEDIHGFLSKFPSGIYADLARRRLKRLEVEEDPSSGSQSGTRTRLTTSTAVKAAHPAEDDPENVPAIDSADSPAQPEAAPRNGASPFIGAQPSAADAVAGVVANPVPAKPVTTPMDRDRPVPARAQLVAGVVVAILGILVVAYFLLSGTQELDPVPPVQVTLEPGKEPTPGNKEMDAGVVPPPVVTSSKPMPVIPSVAASAASTPKKPVTSSQPPDKTQSPSAAGKTPGAPAMPAKQVEAPQAPAGSKSTDTPASAASTDPAAGGDPGKACEGRWLLSFQTCMSEQCSKPQFVNHAVCVERRAMEKRNLDGEQRTGR